MRNLEELWGSFAQYICSLAEILLEAICRLEGHWERESCAHRLLGCTAGMCVHCCLPAELLGDTAHSHCASTTPSEGQTECTRTRESSRTSVSVISVCVLFINLFFSLRHSQISGTASLLPPPGGCSGDVSQVRGGSSSSSVPTGGKDVTGSSS